MAHVLLLPGSVRSPDRIGHHDYLAGCALLAALLRQTVGVSASVVPEGWPADEGALETAQSLVFYTGGGHKQALFRSPQRIDQMQRRVERGVGLVVLHQAIRYPVGLEHLADRWLGGAYVPGKSVRGHWRTHHRVFPAHPVTLGVEAWKIRDGWHRKIQFGRGMQGVTPLLWSSRWHRGSDRGGAADVVAWTYDRPDGGRSFCFTGVDAHSAWSHSGVRQLIVNAILWSSQATIPPVGAPCAVDATRLDEFLTPRGSVDDASTANPRT